MIAKIYCTFAVVALTGCAATQAPTVVEKPVEVTVPVAVPCKIVTPVAPAWSLTNVAPGGDVFEKVKAALAEIEQRAAYEGLLLTAIAACQ